MIDTRTVEEFSGIVEQSTVDYTGIVDVRMAPNHLLLIRSDGSVDSIDKSRIIVRDYEHCDREANSWYPLAKDLDYQETVMS
jgi:hypothetical protein